MRKCKGICLAVIFSLLSLGVFAAPGGGGPGGGGGGMGGAGGPGGSPSGGGGSSAPGGAPSPGGQPSGGGSSSGSGAPWYSSQSKNKSSAPPEIIYYRGSRVLAGDDNFSLQKIKTERMSSSSVRVEITFNQSVNPRSFTADSILVDGNAIPAKTKFSFNKKGDTMKVSVPVRNGSFNLTIQNITSFDGTVIEPIEVKNISDNFRGK